MSLEFDAWPTQTPRVPVDRVFQTAFGKIYGKPCWGVRQGYGSFLTFEFGEPHLVIYEPTVGSRTASSKVRRNLAKRRAFTRGQWHLWIYCCDWQVLSRGRRVGDSSTDARIRRAVDCLSGQKLVQFSLRPQNLQCIFEFDLGGTLKTSPFKKDDQAREQWLLYEPSKKVLVLRADGHYKHVPSDVPENQGDWKTLKGK